MNVGELFAALAALQGSRDAGSEGGGIAAGRLLNGVEYAQATVREETKLRAAWRQRRGGGATPLVLIADDPDDGAATMVLGPQDGGPVRRIRAEALLDLIRRTAGMGRLEAIRHVAQEVERLDTEGVAGLAVRGLGTEHLYGTRLPASSRWSRLAQLAQDVSRASWRELLAGLGYALEALPVQGYLARAGARAALVVHPLQSAGQFARLGADGRLPEGALVGDCEAHGVDYGVLAAGTRLRLFATGAAQAGTTTRYLDLDTATLEPDDLPLLGLLAPAYLAEGGFAELLAEARDYGQRLRLRLDRVLRQDVLPVLGRELGRWARQQGRDLADDAVRRDLEAAALTFVFRALFLLYAESAGHLPMSNHTYAEKSLTRLAARAAEELDRADSRSTALWRDIGAVVEAMRTGQRAWGVPAYNGDLFAADGFDGSATLEAAAIADAALGPALVALARDPEDPEVGVDFSGLEIGHLGHIYEGLLSLRLSLADRDYLYDARRDRYVPADGDDREVLAGDLLWLTNEGGRKSAGVYYTRTELVRHLVRGAVGPAFDRHLQAVRELAATDPAAAAQRLFEFYVLDPACGSAHFLVEVVDELADKIAQLLGQLALPAVREALDALRVGAGPTFGAGVEDTALLKRLVLKRCVYGVDLSPMGAEVAKVSLWLASFVPGLALSYLDHNVQVGNSLIGVARPEEIVPPGADHGQVALFGDSLGDAVRAAAAAAATLRAIQDRTPDEVDASRHAHDELQAAVHGARRLFDLWTAERLGVKGAREEALLNGEAILAGGLSLIADEASARGGQAGAGLAFLHWPLAFAEVFARDNPGFDAVVGNPPWEEVTVEELAFYARYRPGLRALPEAPRRAELAKLLAERPELPAALAAEQQRLIDLRAYLGSAAGYEGGGGDPDTYKYFCQRYRAVLRDGGALGVVLPRSVFLAKGSAGFREWLFREARPRRIDFLLNNRHWAFDIHPQYSVALLIADRAPGEGDAEIEVAGVAASAPAFEAQVAAPGLRLEAQSLGPGLEIPLVPSPAAGSLLKRLRLGEGFAFGARRRWSCFSVYEFHETHDHHLWEGATSGWPLWKGESFEQYLPTGRGARLCPTSKEVMRKVLKARPGAGSTLAGTTALAERRGAVEHEVGRARVVYRRVTRATDSRTIIACLIPPRVFIAYTGPYLAFVTGGDPERAACLGVMNSLPFDWQARRYVELSLSMTVLESLRLPDLENEDFNAIVAAAARLSCPDERFADFAAATGVEVGPLSDAERAGLRAEIDARVARAWKLTADDLETVFADFTLDAVTPAHRDLVRARFAELAPAGA